VGTTRWPRQLPAGAKGPTAMTRDAASWGRGRQPGPTRDVGARWVVSCSVRVGAEVDEGDNWSGGRLTCPAGWVGLGWLHTVVVVVGVIARESGQAHYTSVSSFDGFFFPSSSSWIRNATSIIF